MKNFLHYKTSAKKAKMHELVKPLVHILILIFTLNFSVKGKIHSFHNNKHKNVVLHSLGGVTMGVFRKK
jgi:hypothetical protein